MKTNSRVSSIVLLTVVLFCLAFNAAAQQPPAARALPGSAPGKVSPWPVWHDETDPATPAPGAKPTPAPAHQQSGNEGPALRERVTPASRDNSVPEFEQNLAEARQHREQWREVHSHLPATVPPGKVPGYYNNLLADIKRARDAKNAELNAWSVYYQSFDRWWTGIRDGASVSSREVDKRLAAAGQMLETERAEVLDVAGRLNAMNGQQAQEITELQEIRDTKIENVKELERAVSETKAAVDQVAEMRSHAQTQIDFAARQQRANVIEHILFDAIYQSLELPARKFAAEGAPKGQAQPRGIN